jgi:hypothetical protein
MVEAGFRVDAPSEMDQNGGQSHHAVADFNLRLHCLLTMRNIDDLFAALARSTSVLLGPAVLFREYARTKDTGDRFERETFGARIVKAFS